MLRKFNPAGAPAPQFYSQGVEVTGAERFVFVSGQVGVRSDGSLGEGIAEQAQLAIGNLQAVLQEAGMTTDDLVKTTIYLTDESHFPDFAAAAGPMLSFPPPATTLLYVKALASPAMLVEIEGVAAR